MSRRRNHLKGGKSVTEHVKQVENILIHHIVGSIITKESERPAGASH